MMYNFKVSVVNFTKLLLGLWKKHLFLSLKYSSFLDQSLYLVMLFLNINIVIK